jgi:hypothetical protein
MNDYERVQRYPCGVALPSQDGPLSLQRDSRFDDESSKMSNKATLKCNAS